MQLLCSFCILRNRPVVAEWKHEDFQRWVKAEISGGFGSSSFLGEWRNTLEAQDWRRQNVHFKQCGCLALEDDEHAMEAEEGEEDDEHVIEAEEGEEAEPDEQATPQAPPFTEPTTPFTEQITVNLLFDELVLEQDDPSEEDQLIDADKVEDDDPYEEDGPSEEVDSNQVEGVQPRRSKREKKKPFKYTPSAYDQKTRAVTEGDVAINSMVI